MANLKPVIIALNALIEAYPDIVFIKDSNIGAIVEIQYPSGMAFFMPLGSVNINAVITAIDSVLELIDEENEI